MLNVYAYTGKSFLKPYCMFARTSMLYWVFIDLHNFIDLTGLGLNEECETEFPLIIKPLLPTFLYVQP